jgi:ATP-dependent protease HslVU (ClpYQ) peptidase subunit
MISDSLGSNYYVKNEYVTEKILNPYKLNVDEINEKIIIGCVGSYRHINLLKYGKYIPDDSRLSEREIIVNIVKYIQDLYKLGKCLTTKEEVVECEEILIGDKFGLYKIQSDFSVLTSKEDYMAIGSGENFAMASMHTTKNLHLSEKKRLILAMSSAKKYSTSVGGDLLYMNTNGEKEIIGMM